MAVLAGVAGHAAVLGGAEHVDLVGRVERVLVLEDVEVVRDDRADEVAPAAVGDDAPRVGALAGHEPLVAAVEDRVVEDDGAAAARDEARLLRGDEPGQQKGDSTSLQCECSARARSRNNVHASRPFREMITRPKISQNEWETTEIGAV